MNEWMNEIFRFYEWDRCGMSREIHVVCEAELCAIHMSVRHGCTHACMRALTEPMRTTLVGDIYICTFACCGSIDSECVLVRVCVCFVWINCEMPSSERCVRCPAIICNGIKWWRMRITWLISSSRLRYQYVIALPACAAYSFVFFGPFGHKCNFYNWLRRATLAARRRQARRKKRPEFFDSVGYSVRK